MEKPCWCFYNWKPLAYHRSQCVKSLESFSSASSLKELEFNFAVAASPFFADIHLQAVILPFWRSETILTVQTGTSLQETFFFGLKDGSKDNLLTLLKVPKKMHRLKAEYSIYIDWILYCGKVKLMEYRGNFKHQKNIKLSSRERWFIFAVWVNCYIWLKVPFFSVQFEDNWAKLTEQMCHGADVLLPRLMGSMSAHSRT